MNDTTTSFLTSRLDDAIGWARKYSIFQYPFVTACCGMEYMAAACSHYDVDRFGAGFPRFFSAPGGRTFRRRHDQSQDGAGLETHS